MSPSTSLIPEFKTRDLVAAYQGMVKSVEEIYRLLGEIKQAFKVYLGGSIFPCEICGHRPFIHGTARDLERSKEEILASCWGQIFHRIRNFLPASEIAIIERQIEGKTVPPFTEEEIAKITFSFVSRGEEFKKKMLEGVFNYLRPPGSGLKTNDRSAIDEKAIIRHVIDRNEYYCSLSVYHRDRLWDMDKVFHLLDGKGMPKYPGNLVAVLDQAVMDICQTVETEYFACKWFLNGNLHIRFKRMDLVTEINRIAGGDKLADEGKKRRKGGQW